MFRGPCQICLFTFATADSKQDTGGFVKFLSLILQNFKSLDESF